MEGHTLNTLTVCLKCGLQEIKRKNPIDNDNENHYHLFER